MKRKFIKILPIAVAVLFATSCSKDDVDNTVKTPQEIVQENVDNTINDNVETPQEIVQENDDNTVKTITITGKVSQESLSKVSLVEGTKNLKFDGGETFEFKDEENKVSGKITIADQDGNYTAQLYFKGEGSNLVGPEFTASLNTDPNPISIGYNSLNAAVQNAYYTIKFKVKRVDNNPPTSGYTYKLYTETGTQNDIVVDIQSAFIDASTAANNKGTQLGGEDVTFEAGNYYVVPVGKTMGESTKVTAAGKIYKVTN